MGNAFKTAFLLTALTLLLMFIGRAFGGERVGFKPITKGRHEVYFGQHLIGLLVDADPGGMRPAQRSKTSKPPPPA